MSFANFEMTDEETRRDEEQFAYYAERMLDVCGNCGLRMGTKEQCEACGSLKHPERRPAKPWSWRDRVPKPPGTEAIAAHAGPLQESATIVVEKVDTAVAAELPNVAKTRQKHQDNRPDMEPIKARGASSEIPRT